MVEKWGIPFILDHRPLHLLMKVLSLRNEPSHFAVSSNQVTSVPYPLLLAAGDFFPLLPEIQLCILSVTRCAPLLSGESTRSGYFIWLCSRPFVCGCGCGCGVHLRITCYRWSCGALPDWSTLVCCLFQDKVCEGFILAIHKSLLFPSLMPGFFPSYYSNDYWILTKWKQCIFTFPYPIVYNLAVGTF